MMAGMWAAPVIASLVAIALVAAAVLCWSLWGGGL